jgi:CBS domain-containing protein
VTIEELDFRRVPSDSRLWPVKLLRAEGVDLMEATDLELRRGTPVYVHADAEVIEVQRRMAHNHIRVLPVMNGDEVIGIIDLVDIALIDDLTGRTVADLAS